MPTASTPTRLTTPYADVLLPLSDEEFFALETSIKTYGALDPIRHTEDGKILDGHHRYKIDENAKRVAIPGSGQWSDAECRAYVIGSNWQRRNLSPAQKAELREKMKAIAIQLRDQDPIRWTQEAVARLLGVDRSTVSLWLKPPAREGTNVSAHISTLPEISTNGESSVRPKTRPKPDARVKLSPDQKADVAEKVKGGKSRAKVAANYGINRRAVDKIVAEAEKKAAADSARQERLAELAKREVGGVYHSDFREVAKKIEDESVDLVFTDPPYDREALPLYADLAEIAAAKLVQGGSLICHLGQYQIDEVLKRITPHLRLWWTLAVIHTGESARMTEYGIVVKWKPLLWFVKGTRGDKQTFVDDAVFSSQEKDAHDWQQSVKEASYYIGKLVSRGGLVFDPFCGGGTTAVACKSLEVRCVTCDVDAAALATAKGRLA